MKREISRRTLLRTALIGAATVPATCLSLRADAAAPLPMLDGSDPTAKALGYVPDAGKVDPKANPTFKAGQHCATCVQFQGKAADVKGACNIFVGKQVNATGWCRVWAQKPAQAPSPTPTPTPSPRKKPA
jgi:hypothetical protein